jgi:hypothetical protein
VRARTPPELQGRVYSAADTLIGVPQTISIALGAFLITIVDYRALIVIMALVTGFVGVLLAVGGAPPEPVRELASAAARA